MESASAVQQVTRQKNQSNSSPEVTNFMAAASSTPNRGAATASSSNGHAQGHGHGTEDSGTFSEIASDLGDHPQTQTPSSSAATSTTADTIVIADKPNFAIGLELSRNTTSSFTTCPNSPLDQQNGASRSNSQEELSQGLSSVKFNGKCLKNPTNHGNGTGSVANTSGSYLGLLAENFHAFYQQKLLDIEKEDSSGDHRVYEMKRTSILKAWIKDLMEQNKVLIETVDEMEREAAGKILHLDSKVFQSSQMAMKHMAIIQEYEQQVQFLLAQKSTLEDEASGLRTEVAKLKRKDASLEGKFNELETDNENLITLITRIRDWGVWDISDMALNEKTYYRLFELYPNLAGSEVQTVFTREKAKQVQETEKQLDDLKHALESLQIFKTTAEESLNRKDKLISSCQAEYNELKEKLETSMNENAEYKKSLTEAQNRLAKFQAKALTDSERELNMTEMVQELRDLRNQLRVACTERQNAITEANSLREQVNRHVTEIQNMKHQLASIQDDAQHARSKVQDKEDQLSFLKEQVQSYQKKYDESREMLTVKSEAVQNLQTQMDILSARMIDFERTTQFNALRANNDKISSDLRASTSTSRIVEKPPWNEFFIKGNLHDDDAKMKFKSSSQSRRPRLPVASKSSDDIPKEAQQQQAHQLRNSRMLMQKQHKGHKTERRQDSPRDSNRDCESPRTARNTSAQCSGNTFYAVGDTQTGMKYFFSNEMSTKDLAQKSPRCIGSANSSVLTEFENFKLPPLKETSRSRPGSRQSQKDQEYVQPQQFPPLVMEKPRSRSKTPRSNFGKIDENPITVPGNCQTLDALVSQAVRASKEIVDSFDPSKGQLSLRVRASHRHHSRRPGHDGDGKGKVSEDYTMKTIVKDNAHTSKEDEQTLTSRTESAMSKILCSLPSENQEEYVQNWIFKNASSSQMLKKEAEKQKRVIHTSNVNVTVRRGQSNANLKDIQKKSSKSRGKHTQAHDESGNIPERERNGHLPNRDQSPSKKGKREDYGNYSGCNGIVNNNTEPPPGRNYHVPHPPPDDSRFIALQERICALESQCATKDTLLSSLECELEVEKLAKENTARAMESKDAEITMQKARDFLSTGPPTRPTVAPLQENLLSSYKEILNQEESLASLKSESESLAMRAELLEKNVLLYKSYVLLESVENDYSRGSQSFPCIKGDGDGQSMTDLLPEEILELRKAQTENKELKGKLDLELANIRKLQKELEETAAHKFAEMSLKATELEAFVGNLKTENLELNSELSELTQTLSAEAAAKERAANQENEERKILMNQIQQCVLDLEDKDEQIRVRNEQLARYDEYVTRLHAELKNWANNPLNFSHPSKVQEQNELSQDSRSPKNKEKNEIQSAQIEAEKLKECLQKCERRETELRCENQVLKKTMSQLSLKIEDLVKSMENGRQTDGCENSYLNFKPVPVPSDYQVPLIMTSSQIQEDFGENPQLGSSELVGQKYQSASFQDVANNNSENEKRLQNIESMIEEIRGFVTKK